MATLIDGYNLLYAIGMLGRNIGPGTLARARLALLNFLAASLPEAECDATIVVFDAHDAPRGVPCEEYYRGIFVRYAVGYDDADALVEELIRTHSTPRKLVVVSSDRHIQRMAKRRRAIVVESEVWYDQVCQRRNSPPQPRTSDDIKPVDSFTDAETANWLEVFGDAPLTPPSPQAAEPPPATDSSHDKPSVTDPELLNPFPPGYAEDLLNDE
ncbi:MAG: NYN domain-containing protein [Pirellulaceae bacterium]